MVRIRSVLVIYFIYITLYMLTLLISLPHLSPLVTIRLLSKSLSFCFVNEFICINLILKLYPLSDIIGNLSFSVWLPSLSMIISTSLHVAGKGIISLRHTSIRGVYDIFPAVWPINSARHSLAPSSCCKWHHFTPFNGWIILYCAYIRTISSLPVTLMMDFMVASINRAWLRKTVLQWRLGACIILNYGFFPREEAQKWDSWIMW